MEDEQNNISIVLCRLTSRLLNPKDSRQMGVYFMNFASSFEFAYFTINLHVLSTIELPYFKGALLRGSFGKIFRRLVCMHDKVYCQDCFVRYKCQYAYIFESLSLNRNNPWHSSHDPHPFIIEPPLDDKYVYHSGDNISLGLLLIGEGIDYLPYFVLVFEEMGKTGIGPGKGRFKVIEVIADDLKDGYRVFNGENRTFINYIPRISSLDLNISNSHIKKISVNYITPVRLQQFGKIVDTTIEFPLMIRALMRRYSWLSSVYCDLAPDYPYHEVLKYSGEIKLLESNLIWRKMEHFSYRQKKVLKLGGLIGSVVFEGDIGFFMPLLKLGEYLHIGKSTVFGLGKYRLSVENTIQDDICDYEALSN
jgi:hypothetical protein